MKPWMDSLINKIQFIIYMPALQDGIARLCWLNPVMYDTPATSVSEEADFCKNALVGFSNRSGSRLAITLT